MEAQWLTIGLAFLEGIGLIISPCILPILPIILAGSLTGSKRRPLGIICGFVIIFIAATLFSRKLVQYSGIDLNSIRHFSYAILLLLGIIMLSTYLTEKFSRLTQRFSNVGASFTAVNDPQSGFAGGMLFGGLIAIIWTPCAGPILAAVIVQTVIQQTNFMSFLILLAFSIGVVIPMLLIAFLGRGIMEKFRFFKAYAALFRKILGAIIIGSVVYLIYAEGGISTSVANEASNDTALSLRDGLLMPYPAPQISGIAAWINSTPLQLSDLKGKVVLIDFWTYSCINCIRTFPYLKSWYQKYHDKGLVMIGVHTPEFDFEKNLNNVKRAVEKNGLQYAIALDNDFVTWRNFNNRYWPAHYLIDKNGNVVYTHFGEGHYDITENNIRYLLGLKEVVTMKTIQEASSLFGTPETYLGYGRADRFASKEDMRQDQAAQYTFPETLSRHRWALQGSWTIMRDNIVSAGNNAALKINFHARRVYLVMGNAAKKPIQVKLLLNGERVIAEKGKDVVNSSITVGPHRLYDAVVLDRVGDGILQLIPSSPGLEVYTFTFGF